MAFQAGFGSIKRWQKFKDETSILRRYFWEYRKLLSIGLLSLVIVDVLEVLPPYFLKLAVDIVVDHRPMSFLAEVAIAYFAVALFQGIGRYGWRMFLIRASLLSGRDLRAAYSKHLFSLSHSFFDRRPIGELMSLATSDVEAVRMTLGPGVLILADALFYFLTIPVAMFLLSPQLTLLAFIPLPIIPFLVWRNEKEIHERFEKVQEGYSKLSAFVQEGFNGVRVTKAFAKEELQNERFKKVGEEYLRSSMVLARVQNSFGPTLDFTMSLGLVILLFVAGRGIIEGHHSAVTLGTFVAFHRYIQKMVWPMAALGMAIGYYQRSLSSSKRLKEVFSTHSDVKDLDLLHKMDSVSEGIRPHRSTSCVIQIKNLSFAFQSPRSLSTVGTGFASETGTNPSLQFVLKNIHLEIRPGECVAFMGSIGGGKSTLLSLIPRLYPVPMGSIWVSGIDINEWKLKDLREQIGFVSQDVFLFSDTIENNISYGLNANGSGAGPKEVESSAADSWLHEDILRMPLSYKTKVGERGVTLSGGQKQRISLARALVKSPPILILDDAFSSVDIRTEEKILSSLRNRWNKGTPTTALISSHRVSTIRNADRIVLLERGEIIQMGTHQKLYREKTGLYRTYYDQQKMREDLEQEIFETTHLGSGSVNDPADQVSQLTSDFIKE